MYVIAAQDCGEATRAFGAFNMFKVWKWLLYNIAVQTEERVERTILC